MRATVFLAFLPWLLTACQVPSAFAPAPREAPDTSSGTDAESAAPLVDVPISRAPYANVAANWKHRLDQAYVYVEHVGDYRELGRSVRVLLEAADAQAMTAAGSMFALFYDDPGDVPAHELRARVCLPVSPGTAPRGALRFDVLESTPVAYAVVAGAYAETPLCYPALLGFLRERAWKRSGPIRHVYLNPGAARAGGELLTEVQVPWTAQR